jgi:hypothetical protein
MQTLNHRTSNYKGEKKIAIYKAITILAKDNIQVDEDEAAIILNFLYHIAKMYSKAKTIKTAGTIRKHRTAKKLPDNI